MLTRDEEEVNSFRTGSPALKQAELHLYKLSLSKQTADIELLIYVSILGALKEAKSLQEMLNILNEKVTLPKTGIFSYPVVNKAAIYMCGFFKQPYNFSYSILVLKDELIKCLTDKFQISQNNVMSPS